MPAFQDPQKTDTVPFVPQRLTEVTRGAKADKHLRCTPASAQKNPNAVPGDIPELDHEE
jgi:hypothetical protein